jgi:hypothetical protein
LKKGRRRTPGEGTTLQKFTPHERDPPPHPPQTPQLASKRSRSTRPRKIGGGFGRLGRAPTVGKAASTSTLPRPATAGRGDGGGGGAEFIDMERAVVPTAATGRDRPCQSGEGTVWLGDITRCPNPHPPPLERPSALERASTEPPPSAGQKRRPPHFNPHSPFSKITHTRNNPPTPPSARARTRPAGGQHRAKRARLQRGALCNRTRKEEEEEGGGRGRGKTTSSRTPATRCRARFGQSTRSGPLDAPQDRPRPCAGSRDRAWAAFGGAWRRRGRGRGGAHQKEGQELRSFRAPLGAFTTLRGRHRALIDPQGHLLAVTGGEGARPLAGKKAAEGATLCSPLWWRGRGRETRGARAPSRPLLRDHPGAFDSSGLSVCAHQAAPQSDDQARRGGDNPLPIERAKAGRRGGGGSARRQRDESSPQISSSWQLTLSLNPHNKHTPNHPTGSPLNSNRATTTPTKPTKCRRRRAARASCRRRARASSSRRRRPR